MSIMLRIALIVITIIYLLLIINSVKKRKMQTSIAIFWIITGILLIIAISIPNLIELISKIMGFEQTSNMIFCLTIFIAFCLILSITILLAKQSNRTTTLIQEISILRKRISILEEKNNDNVKNIK